MAKFKIHSVQYNFIMNFILKISMVIFPLLTTPYVMSVLGVEGYGRTNFVISVISYLTTFSSLGIPLYGVKVCAQYRNDPKALTKVVQELMIVSAVMIVVAYAALAVLIVCVPKLFANKSLLLVCSVSILFTNMGMEWLYQAIEQYDYITLRNIIFKLLSFVMLFLFVRTEQDILVYVGISTVATVGSNIFNLYKSRDYVSWKPVGGYDFKQHFRPILSFFALTVATTVYGYLNVMMLGFIKSDLEVGYYSVAVKVKTLLVSVVTAIGTVLLPRITSIISDDQKDLFYQMIKKSFEVVMLFGVYSVLFFVVEAQETSHLLTAGQSHVSAVRSVQIMTPAVLLIGLSNITGIQILIPLGKEKWTALSTIAGAVVNLAMNLILIPRYGAVAAAAGTLTAELVVLLVQIPAVWREVSFRDRFGEVCKMLLSGAAATGLLLALKRTVPISGAILAFLIHGILYTLVYGVMLCLLRESFVMEQLVKIWSYVKKRLRAKKK